MVRLLEQGLDDGACGMSTGLEYAPAMSARPGRARRPVRRRWRLGAGRTSRTCAGTRTGRRRRSRSCSTWRGPPASAPTSRTSTVRPTCWRRMVDAALAEGLDVTFDSYPYLKGSSILALVALPAWLPLADADRTLAMLQDPVRPRRAAAARRRLAARDDLVGARLRLGRRTVAARGRRAPRHEPDRRRPPPARRRRSCRSDACSSSRRAPPSTRCACSRSTPRTARGPTASTSAATRTRAAGARSRGYLGRHTRELADWSWPEAAAHLSTTAARRFGLADRGSLRVGGRADLVVLDPATVIDRATYDAPRSLATGVQAVLVNGVPALRDGR